jgi:hypothetical protein
MAQTILYEIQQAAVQLSLAPPADAFGSQDETALMMGSAANLAGPLINGLRVWQFMCAPVSFAGDGVRAVYALPSDFDRFVDSTGWSTLNAGPVQPMSSRDAAGQRDSAPLQPYRCRLFGGMLEFLTPPIDGDTITFEYVRKTWVLDAEDITTRKEIVNKNGDIPVFDWVTMILAIKVKWLELKRMDNAAAMSDLMDRLGQNANADVMGGTISLVPGRGGYRYLDPMYNLPAGGYGGP